MSAQEVKLLRDTLNRFQFKGKHLEVGTAAGGTLVRMLDTMVNDASFVVVDRMRYFPNQRDIFIQNLRNHQIDPRTIDLRETTSFKAFRMAYRNQERFDVVVIDASHKIVSVTADLRWTRLLNVGGIVLLHDYCDRFPGVMRSVDRFLRRQSNYKIINRADSLVAIQKLDRSSHDEIDAWDWSYACTLHIPLEFQRRKQNRQRMLVPA